MPRPEGLEVVDVPIEPGDAELDEELLAAARRIEADEDPAVLCARQVISDLDVLFEFEDVTLPEPVHKEVENILVVAFRNVIADALAEREFGEDTGNQSS